MTICLVRRFSKIAILTTAAAIAGCSTAKLSLEVDSNVPKPITKTIPIDMGVYYSDNFRNFVYKEKSQDREEWTIDNRKSRLNLFNQVLSSMFDSIKPVDNTKVSKNSSDIEAILEPDVLEMQLGLPSETQLDFYEAWVKYDMKLYQPDGALISQWEIAAYGKASSESFGGATEGLNAAIDSALRDAGAKMSLDFTKNQDVADWLCGRQKCPDSTE